jgi:hypothetical protein
MARRPNYGAEKRAKELGKQRRKEEKAEKKRARKEAGLSDSDVTHDGEFDGQPVADGEDDDGDEGGE